MKQNTEADHQTDWTNRVKFNLHSNAVQCKYEKRITTSTYQQYPRRKHDVDDCFRGTAGTAVPLLQPLPTNMLCPLIANYTEKPYNIMQHTHTQSWTSIYNVPLHIIYICVSELLLVWNTMSCCRQAVKQTDKNEQTQLYTLYSEKKHPLLFSCKILRKSNQFEWKFQTK